tara:strand:+ start:12 stop:776 length:765 start_codon:yes stop_codon:yes gene_type:complete
VINDVIVYPIFNLSSIPRTLIDNIISESKNIDLLEQEIKDLRQENMNLKIQVQELDGLREENKRLRKVKVQSEKTSKKQLIAKIISDSASPTKNIVAIDKGKNDGVFIGQNVIGIKGLIGQVTETTFMSSKIILINDASHNVPGEINRTGEKVIVSGTRVKNKLKIDFLDVNTDIKVGDIVSTSGLGKRFKAKIPIGKVTLVDQNPEREFSVIEINSFENLENLTDLILIWDYKPNVKNNKLDVIENKEVKDSE